MRVTGLYVYPIKSCRGIQLEAAEVVARGLAFDRRYMLVDAAGAFVTQRQAHELCLVGTAFDGARLLVSAPNRPTLELPRELMGSATLERHPYSVWGSSGQALCHPEGSQWFSELLDDEIRLLYMPDDEHRRVNPERARPGDIVSFADGYPLLVISEASLLDLNSRLPAPLEMRRFRPNLVVTGCEAFAEDGFARLRVGAVTFRGVKRCERCVVTTLDPETGAAGKEPLRTLATYRLEDGKVWFGMNLIHDGPGWLRVGDDVALLT